MEVRGSAVAGMQPTRHDREREARRALRISGGVRAMGGNVIWKYAVPLTEVRHQIHMPADARVLALQLQHDEPTLWAQVDPDSPKVSKVFEWVGTGHEVPHGGQYVGTVQVQGGDFVFHLYEAGAA